MIEIFHNFSTENLEVTLEKYRPTDKLLFTLNTFTSTHSFVITEQQLTQLRVALSFPQPRCSKCGVPLDEKKAFSIYNAQEDKFELLCYNCSAKKRGHKRDSGQS
jgi:hypothetical protein